MTIVALFPNAADTGPLDGRDSTGSCFALPSRGRLAGFRWKELRHTFATRLRIQNADLMSIRELIGHTTTRMTEHNAHAAPGYLLETVQRISREPTDTATDTWLADDA